MTRLLKIEWHKISGYRTFWILLGLHFVLLTIFAFSLENLNTKFEFDANGGAIQPAKMLLEQLPILKFPAIWNNIAYLFSWFSFFLALIVIILVTNEFKFKTLRQNIIDGMGKGEVIVAKEMLIILMSLFSTAYLAVVVMILGKSGSYSDGIIALPAYFAYLMVYLNMAFLLAMLIRSSGLAIGALIIYVIVEKIVSWRLPENIGEWLPNSLIAAFFPNPFQGIMGGTVSVNFTILQGLACCIYVGLFLAVIFWLLKRGQAAK